MVGVCLFLKAKMRLVAALPKWNCDVIQAIKKLLAADYT